MIITQEILHKQLQEAIAQINLAHLSSENSNTAITPNWYATLDASQIPTSLDIHWAALSQQYEWANLLANTAEGEESDLTCWLVPLKLQLHNTAAINSEMLTFTIMLASQHPYSCTWLQSAWSLEEISQHWQKTSNVKLPNSKQGLLRFYDPCVLQTLTSILTKSQWHSVYAPCRAWLHINRVGQLNQLTTPISRIKPSASIQLNNAQLTELQNSNQEDHIIANLMAEEHLNPTSNPFENYAKVSAAITALKQHNINDAGQCYAFCMTTLDWTVEDYQSAHLTEQLQLVQQGKLDLQSITQPTPTKPSENPQYAK